MKETIDAINTLKSAGLVKDYAIGGAIGVLRWVEPFFTRDLDVFVISADVQKRSSVMDFSPLYGHLKGLGYNQWVGQWIMIGGVPTEFIPAEGLAKEAVEHSQEVTFEGSTTKVMTPEYLIALLLQVAREKDTRKISLMLEQAKLDQEKLQDILKRYGLTERFHNVKGNVSQ